jgi:phage shock protein PspC (stress-responsive transcriptional regulator)
MTEMPHSAPDTGPRVTREQMRDLSTLRRVKEPRTVGGVAEGLSRHFDIDPLIVRVVFAALSVFGGAGIALYILMWVTIPEEGEYDSILSRPLHRDPYRVMLAGLAIAALATIGTMFGAISLSTPNPVPVLVLSAVAIAAFALFSRRSDPPGQPYQAYPPPDVQPAGAATAVPFTGTAYTSAAGYPGVTPVDAPGSPAVDAPDNTTTTQPIGDAATAVLATGGGGMGTSYRAPSPAPPPPPPPPPGPPRSHLFGITMACLAIAMGVLWVVDETIHSLPPAAYPASALAVTAAGLIVGAWWGRSRLLIVVGLLATLATVAASVVGPGPYGERTYRPGTAASLQPTYTMGAGRIDVHLEDIADPGNLSGRALQIISHIGQVELIVPSSVNVAVNAHVDHGDIRGLADVRTLDRGEQRVTATAGRHDLTVDLALDFGEIVVKRLDCPGQPISPTATAITLTTTEDRNVAPACN